MFSTEKIMRSPSTLAVWTASGIILTESPSSELDEAAFDDEDDVDFEDELTSGALDVTLELTLVYVDEELLSEDTVSPELLVLSVSSVLEELSELSELE